MNVRDGFISSGRRPPAPQGQSLPKKTKCDSCGASLVGWVCEYCHSRVESEASDCPVQYVAPELKEGECTLEDLWPPYDCNDSQPKGPKGKMG